MVIAANLPEVTQMVHLVAVDRGKSPIETLSFDRASFSDLIQTPARAQLMLPGALQIAFPRIIRCKILLEPRRDTKPVGLKPPSERRFSAVTFCATDLPAPLPSSAHPARGRDHKAFAFRRSNLASRRQCRVDVSRMTDPNAAGWKPNGISVMSGNRSLPIFI